MESSLPRERHGERKARGDPGEPRRQRPFITDSGRGGLSKIYGIRKHLLTHCYRGVFAIAWEWWDIGEILRGRVETLIEGKEPRPGVSTAHPAPPWGALTAVSRRTALVSTINPVIPARWFLLPQAFRVDARCGRIRLRTIGRHTQGDTEVNVLEADV